MARFGWRLKPRLSASAAPATSSLAVAAQRAAVQQSASTACQMNSLACRVLVSKGQPAQAGLVATCEVAFRRGLSRQPIWLLRI